VGTYLVHQPDHLLAHLREQCRVARDARLERRVLLQTKQIRPRVGVWVHGCVRWSEQAAGWKGATERERTRAGVCTAGGGDERKGEGDGVEDGCLCDGFPQLGGVGLPMLQPLLLYSAYHTVPPTIPKRLSVCVSHAPTRTWVGENACACVCVMRVRVLWRPYHVCVLVHRVAAVRAPCCADVRRQPLHQHCAVRSAKTPQAPETSNQTRQIQSNPTNPIKPDKPNRMRSTGRARAVPRARALATPRARRSRRARRRARRGPCRPPAPGGRHVAERTARRRRPAACDGPCLADRRARVHHVGAQHLERVRGLPPVAGTC
jgi:hypothetical protein